MNSPNGGNAMIPGSFGPMPPPASTAHFLQFILKALTSNVRIHRLLSSWINLDLNSLASIITIFGTLSAIVAFGKNISVKVYWYITRFFTSSISITASDSLNKEILNWLGAHVLPRQATRILTARSEHLESEAYAFDHHRYNRYGHMIPAIGPSNTNKRPPIQYLPTFGTTWFVHARNIFLIRRVAARNSGTVPDEYASAPEGHEPLVVMCLGRSVEPIKRFIDTCRNFADTSRGDFVSVYRARFGNSWDDCRLRPARSLQSVHFDEDEKAALVKDIGEYLDPNTARFYNERGIPYRRGYLLHGPAGTGKTSLSMALSGHFDLPLYLLHMPSVGNDQYLESLFDALPPRCIVLLEDIDAVGRSRTAPPRRMVPHQNPYVPQPFYDSSSDEDGSKKSSDDDDVFPTPPIAGRVTLSGMLNCLDGVGSQEGRIVIMTSNHAEKLDAALTRPGRIDRKIFMGAISPDCAELMFLRMYLHDEEDEEVSPKKNKEIGLKDKDVDKKIPSPDLKALGVAFAKLMPDAIFTPAELQGYLLMYRNDPAAAVRDVTEWIKTEGERKEEAKKDKQKAAKKRKEAKSKARKQAQERAKKAERARNKQLINVAVEAVRGAQGENGGGANGSAANGSPPINPFAAALGPPAVDGYAMGLLKHRPAANGMVSRFPADLPPAAVRALANGPVPFRMPPRGPPPAEPIATQASTPTSDSAEPLGAATIDADRLVDDQETQDAAGKKLTNGAHADADFADLVQ